MFALSSVWKFGGLDSLQASGGFICQGITYANSLDPDKSQQNVGLDLRSKLFDNSIILL